MVRSCVAGSGDLLTGPGEPSIALVGDLDIPAEIKNTFPHRNMCPGCAQCQISSSDQSVDDVPHVERTENIGNVSKINARNKIQIKSLVTCTHLSILPLKDGQWRGRD